MKKAIFVSGYFNPIYKGCIDYFILKKDRRSAFKGSKKFQQEDEIVFIVSNIKSCYRVFANENGENNYSVPESLACEALSIKLLDSLTTKFSRQVGC